MKVNLFIMFGMISVILLTACGTDGEESVSDKERKTKVEQTDRNEGEPQGDSGTSKKEEKGTKEGFLREVSQVGNFETFSMKENLGTIKSGPLSFKMKKVSVLKGIVDPGYRQGKLPDKKIDVVTFNLYGESEEREFQFDETHFTLRTGKGEIVEEPNGMLSSAVFPLAFVSGERFTVITFLLEESKAEEIQNVTFQIKAPTDKNGEPLGEDVKLDIDLS